MICLSCWHRGGQQVHFYRRLIGWRWHIRMRLSPSLSPLWLMSCHSLSVRSQHSRLFKSSASTPVSLCSSSTSIWSRCKEPSCTGLETRNTTIDIQSRVNQPSYQMSLEVFLYKYSNQVAPLNTDHQFEFNSIQLKLGDCRLSLPEDLGRRTVWAILIAPENHLLCGFYTCYLPTQVTMLLPFLVFVTAAQSVTDYQILKSWFIRQQSPLPHLARGLCDPG